MMLQYVMKGEVTCNYNRIRRSPAIQRRNGNAITQKNWPEKKQISICFGIQKWNDEMVALDQEADQIEMKYICFVPLHTGTI